jgi:hypothetical protein
LKEFLLESNCFALRSVSPVLHLLNQLVLNNALRVFTLWYAAKLEKDSLKDIPRRERKASQALLVENARPV